MARKGQAAMEFLMTYGWAILVVLAAIGALAYFGVLSPDKFLPRKCTIEAGFSCVDFTVDSGGDVTLYVQNGLGFDASNVTVSVEGTALANCNGVTFNDGQQVTCGPTTVSAGLAGSRFKGDITIGYTNPSSGAAHTLSGSLTTKTE